MRVLSVDQSMRSTGVALVSDGGVLEECALIRTEKPLEKVDIVHAVGKEMTRLCAEWKLTPGDTCAVLEGISFAAKSSSRDVLAGLQYHLWWILEKNLGLTVGIVPVTSWRSRVLSKEEQREAKKVKDGLKVAVLEKVPAEAVAKMRKCVEAAGAKEKALFDLADAYWMGVYRLGLDQRS